MFQFCITYCLYKIKAGGIKMNLNEAIEHLNDILSEDRWNECMLCKREHEQLRDLLIELKN